MQPMHVGFTSDEGGNTIDLRWFRHKSNLHHVCPALIESKFSYFDHKHPESESKSKSKIHLNVVPMKINKLSLMNVISYDNIDLI